MNQINQMIITSLLQWLLSPETIMFIITFVIGMPKLIEKFKQAKREQYKTIAAEFATDIIKELALRIDISNAEKLNVAVTMLYNIIPAPAKKYLSKDDIVVIINGIYHTHIKPEINK